METRLIPVIDNSGLRSYLEVPGGTIFEGAYFINSLLSDAVRLDMSLLHLTEEEVQELDKQTECKKIRERMRELNYKKLEAISLGINPIEYKKEWHVLSGKLFRLEREMKKGSAQL